jgi:hypothetical protein
VADGDGAVPGDGRRDLGRLRTRLILRDDREHWQQIDASIAEQLDVRFSQGICPECRETIIKPRLEQMRRESKERS